MTSITCLRSNKKIMKDVMTFFILHLIFTIVHLFKYYVIHVIFKLKYLHVLLTI